MKNRKLLLLAIPLLILLIGAVVFKPKTSQNLAADINFNDTVEEELNTMYIIHDTLLEEEKFELKIIKRDSIEFDSIVNGRIYFNPTHTLTEGAYKLEVRKANDSYISTFFAKEATTPIIWLSDSIPEILTVSPSFYIDEEEYSFNSIVTELWGDTLKTAVLAGDNLKWPLENPDYHFDFQSHLPSHVNTFGKLEKYLKDYLNVCGYLPHSYYFPESPQTFIIVCDLEYINENGTPDPEYRHIRGRIPSIEKQKGKNTWQAILNAIFTAKSQLFRTYVFILSTENVSLLPNSGESIIGTNFIKGSLTGIHEGLKVRYFDKESHIAKVCIYDHKLNETEQNKQFIRMAAHSSNYEHVKKCLNISD